MIDHLLPIQWFWHYQAYLGPNLAIIEIEVLLLYLICFYALDLARTLDIILIEILIIDSIHDPCIHLASLGYPRYQSGSHLVHL